jgi:hypothetical protein
VRGVEGTIEGTKALAFIAILLQSQTSSIPSALDSASRTHEDSGIVLPGLGQLLCRKTEGPVVRTWCTG